MAGNPRYANGAARRKIREWLKNQGNPCAICGKPIDYTLDWYIDPKDGKRKRHPLSFEVDEIVPISKGGSPIRRDNVRSVHRVCNQRRGNKTAYIPPITAPETAELPQPPIDWTK